METTELITPHGKSLFFKTAEKDEELIIENANELLIRKLRDDLKFAVIYHFPRYGMVDQSAKIIYLCEKISEGRYKLINAINSRSLTTFNKNINELERIFKAEVIEIEDKLWKK